MALVLTLNPRVPNGPDANLLFATVQLVTDPIITLETAVITTPFNQINVTWTIGQEGGFANAGDWNAIAALMNASAAGSLIQAIGSISNDLSALPVSQSLLGGTNNQGGELFFFAAGSPAPPPVSAGSGPGRGLPQINVNVYDMCLGVDFGRFERIDPQAFACGRKPLCFYVDERDWSGIEDAEEIIQSGPPQGAVTLNPSGAIPLPDPSAGNVVIFQFRVPLGYDGILLGQFHDYVPSPQSPPSPFVQGSGDISWRIAIDGRYARDCGNMTVSLGSSRALSTIAGGIQLRSGNLVQYVAQFNNTTGSLTPGLGSLPAGLHGYGWPRR